MGVSGVSGRQPVNTLAHSLRRPVVLRLYIFHSDPRGGPPFFSPACFGNTVATGKRRHAGLVPRGKLQEMTRCDQDVHTEIAAEASFFRSNLFGVWARCKRKSPILCPTVSTGFVFTVVFW